MSIHERMKWVLDKENISLKQASERTGIPYRSLQNYISGNQQPGTDALAKFYSTFKADLNWLISGEGSYSSSLDGLSVNRTSVDAALFKKVVEALNSSDSELRGVRLEHLLDHVITVYNSLLQCESQSEKDRMLHAQIQLLNKLVAPHIVENLKSLEPLMEGEQKTLIRKDIEAYEKLASSQVTTTQHISGAHHQIAGRDVVNKDKS